MTKRTIVMQNNDSVSQLVDYAHQHLRRQKRPLPNLYFSEKTSEKYHESFVFGYDRFSL